MEISLDSEMKETFIPRSSLEFPRGLSLADIADKPQQNARKLCVNITLEYICNVDTKLETFDTRYFFRFEWEPTEKERSKIDKEVFRKNDVDIDIESPENKDNSKDEKQTEKEKEKEKLNLDEINWEKYFKCPKFRYPNAKEFDIIQDDGIKYDPKTKKAKGGYLMTATILEKLELRNFPLDVQHFSIIIECVDTLNDFEFFPRVSDDKPSHRRSSSSEISMGDLNSNRSPNRYVPKNKFVRLRSENLILSDFELRNLVAEITESKEENASNRNRKHTILFVSVVMERVAEAYLWRLGLCLSIVNVCGLTTWSVESLDNRLNMLFTLLLTMIALQMVINSIIPNIPYLTLMDKYTIFSFCFIFILILETAVSGVGNYYDGNVDHVFFWIFMSFFLLFHVVFAYYSHLKSKNEEKIKSSQCRHERDEYYKDDQHLKTYDEYSIDALQRPVDCPVVGKKYYDTTVTNPDD